ncbi:MAG: DUF1015 domain-containing protein [Crocinitomicaceae bacterium]|nr:DUF1015 domain-containing protein [Crocinitomicaceae bacterium]MDG1777384.1 DUF1015 domain-containing protein [Crocinitomicaceae bacterium]
MTKISPFRAIRPTRDKAHLVPTRPYYIYNKRVLKSKLKHNPYTFLHIINPEFRNKSSVDLDPNERFNLISEAYVDFIDKGVLIQDENPHFYIYRQIKGENAYLGIIAGASIEEYKNGAIKKHEATIKARETMFTNYLDIVGYNAEPVLLSYHDPKDEIEALLQQKIKGRPEYEFRTTDEVKHELWLFHSSESEHLINAFDTIQSSYIADGHHRSASSARLKEFRAENGANNFPNEDFFLAYFINEDRLQIMEFNRLVKQLNGLSASDLLTALAVSFTVEPLDCAQKPTQEHEFTMFIDNQWYKLTCKPSIIDKTHPVKCLDSEILTRSVLGPILNIHNLESDSNIEFISGKEDLLVTESNIREGMYDVGFFLYPVTIEQIKCVADNNMTMPPKSTWIDPKLRSGLTIYNINE